MHRNIFLFADYPFPVTIQTRVYVLAALIWAQMQTMTLRDILATGGARHLGGLGLRLVLVPTLDATGHVVDLDARIATRAEARISTLTSTPGVMSVPVTSDEATFMEAFADQVEREWLGIEIDLRMGRGERELGRFSGAELLQAREELGQLWLWPWRLASCRHLWILSQALRRELQMRGDQEPSLHKRFEHARACQSLSDGVTAEMAKACKWHEKTMTHKHPWRVDLKPFADEDIRHLVLHRAAQAEACTKKALVAARKEVKRLARTAGGGPAR